MFNFGTNFFSGSIPCSFGEAWPSITDFFFDNNYLTGNLPSSVASWQGLLNFDIKRNYFDGTLPSELINWISIERVSFSENPLLSGTLGVAISSWTYITLLYLGKTKLSGTLPDSFASISLYRFSVSGTLVSGTLPEAYAKLLSLTYIDISTTAISGSLPPVYELLQELTFFGFKETYISGSLPDSFRNLSKMTAFDARAYLLSGTLPPSFGCWASLTEVFFSSMSGTLPESFSAWLALDRFDVFVTKISGTLPSYFANWTQVSQFYVDYTELSGTLPGSFQSFSGLVAFYFAHTKVSGTLPASFAEWTTLSSFFASSNKLSGTLPSVYEQLRSLTLFSASRNVLTGNFPNLSQWSSNLANVNLDENQFVGQFSVELLPTDVKYVDVSHNQLTGPVELTNLPASMILLNLSSNQYRSLLLTVYDLTVPPDQTGVFVLDLTNNDVICPFPGLSQIYRANKDSKAVTVLREVCRDDLYQLFPYAISLCCFILLTVAAFLILKFQFLCVLVMLEAWLKSRAYFSFRFIFALLVQQFSFVNACLAFSDMFDAVSAESPNNCDIFNQKTLWINSMPNIFYNSDGTIYPPSGVYSNFSTYATLLRSGFPNVQYPESVQSNLETFKSRCALFGNNGECVYQQDESSNFYACVRVVDRAGNLRLFFLKLLIASVLVFFARETLKLVSVIYEICIQSERSLGAMVQSSRFRPLLLYSLGTARFESFVVFYQPTFRDRVWSFLYDGFNAFIFDLNLFIPFV